MKNIVISMLNTLLSESVSRALSETGDFRTEQILPDKVSEIETVCQSVHANVLLMEVNRYPLFTLEARLALATRVRKLGCKVALLCDENADKDIAHLVKNARQDRLVDGFIYASVTPAYLVAAIDAL